MKNVNWSEYVLYKINGYLFKKFWGRNPNQFYLFDGKCDEYPFMGFYKDGIKIEDEKKEEPKSEKVISLEYSNLTARLRQAIILGRTDIADEEWKKLSIEEHRLFSVKKLKINSDSVFNPYVFYAKPSELEKFNLGEIEEIEGEYEIQYQCGTSNEYVKALNAYFQLKILLELQKMNMV